MAKLPKLDKNTPEEVRIKEAINKFQNDSTSENESVARKSEAIYLKAQYFFEAIKSIVTEGSFKTNKDVAEAIEFLDDIKKDIDKDKKVTPELKTDLSAYVESTKKTVESLVKATKKVEKKIKIEIVKSEAANKIEVNEQESVAAAIETIVTPTKAKTTPKKTKTAKPKPKKEQEETIDISESTPSNSSTVTNSQISASIVADLIGRLADPEPEPKKEEKAKKEKLTPEERIRRSLLQQEENRKIREQLRIDLGLVKPKKEKTQREPRQKLTPDEIAEALLARQKALKEAIARRKEAENQNEPSIVEPDTPELLVPDDITVPKLLTTVKQPKPRNYDNLHEQALRMDAARNTAEKKKRERQLDIQHDEALKENRNRAIQRIAVNNTNTTQPQILQPVAQQQQQQSSSLIVKFLGVITAALVANGYFSKAVKDNLDKILKEAEEKNNQKKLKAEEAETERQKAQTKNKRRGRKKETNPFLALVQNSIKAIESTALGATYMLSNKFGTFIDQKLMETGKNETVDKLTEFLLTLNLSDLVTPTSLGQKAYRFYQNQNNEPKPYTPSTSKLDVDNPNIPINMRSFMSAIGKKESNGDYKIQADNGFLGKYQMGTEALEDLGLIKKGTSDKFRRTNSKGESYIQEKAALNMAENWTEGYNRDLFLNNPKLQDDMFIKRNLANYRSLLSKGILKPSDSPEKIADFLARAQFGLSRVNNTSFKDGKGTAILEMGRIGRESQENLETNIFARGDAKVGMDWYKDDSVRRQRAKQKQAEKNGYTGKSEEPVGDASQLGRKSMLEKLEKSNEEKKPPVNIISHNTNNSFIGGGGGSGWMVQPVASPVDRNPLVREMLA